MISKMSPALIIFVLMPCRALEAFRPAWVGSAWVWSAWVVLMPCRALEAFRLTLATNFGSAYIFQFVLMPCRALEAFRRLLAEEYAELLSQS